MLPLKPFSPNHESIRVDAGFETRNQNLIFEYRLDDPRLIILDTLKTGKWSTRSRADELWKTTCFEAFIGRRNEPGYWEFNFSPGLQKWNVYAFDDYRIPQPPRASDQFELQSAVATHNSLQCTLLSTTPLTDLEISLTAVIRTQSGVNYYALEHTGAKPDFHDRRSFVLQL